MGFFESLPAVPPVLSVRPEDGPWMSWMRPELVVPGSVAARVLLIHTDEVAVVVNDVRAFANGFELTVRAYQRCAPAGGRWMSRGPRVVDVDGDPDELKLLRFGVLFADGRRGATPRLPGPLQREAPAAGEVLIAERGRQGGWQEWVSEYWIHPLPPQGPVTFIASWLGWDVPETQGQVDGALILQAAQRAVRLWPDRDPPVGSSTG